MAPDGVRDLRRGGAGGGEGEQRRLYPLVHLQPHGMGHRCQVRSEGGHVGMAERTCREPLRTRLLVDVGVRERDEEEQPHCAQHDGAVVVAEAVLEKVHDVEHLVAVFEQKRVRTTATRTHECLFDESTRASQLSVIQSEQRRSRQHPVRLQ